MTSDLKILGFQDASYLTAAAIHCQTIGYGGKSNLRPISQKLPEGSEAIIKITVSAAQIFYANKNIGVRFPHYHKNHHIIFVYLKKLPENALQVRTAFSTYTKNTSLQEATLVHFSYDILGGLPLQIDINPIQKSCPEVAQLAMTTQKIFKDGVPLPGNATLDNCHVSLDMMVFIPGKTVQLFSTTRTVRQIFQKEEKVFCSTGEWSPFIYKKQPLHTVPAEPKPLLVESFDQYRAESRGQRILLPSATPISIEIKEPPLSQSVDSEKMNAYLEELQSNGGTICREDDATIVRAKVSFIPPEEKR